MFGGLFTGAGVAPCIAPRHRRAALWLNIVGLVCCVGPALFFSQLAPWHPDDALGAGQLFGFGLGLALFFFALEGVACLLHWRRCQWRNRRKRPCD